MSFVTGFLGFSSLQNAGLENIKSAKVFCIKEKMDYRNLIKTNTMLSPLAGYTDAAFRVICREFGAGLTVTEMVSAKSLQMNNRNALDLLFSFEEGPKAVQLFGSDVEAFKAAVEKEEVQKYDIIEINMGCPVPKIVRGGGGSALMTDTDSAEKIIKAVVHAASKPVSVKFRLGWDERSINCVDFAKMCEQSGASSITLHARTRTQMYMGKARHEFTAEVVRAVKIPVWANGDIASKKAAEDVKQQTNCYGVSVGRGALGNPQIFKELAGEETQTSKTEIMLVNERRSLISKQIQLMTTYLPAKVIVNEMKKHIAFYLKGLKDSRPALKEINEAGSLDGILLRTNAYFDKLISDN